MGGLTDFIFFKAHCFICEHFSGGGGVFNKLLYIDGVGIKTWLKKVHGGWDMGG